MLNYKLIFGNALGGMLCAAQAHPLPDQLPREHTHMIYMIDACHVPLWLMPHSVPDSPPSKY